MPTEKKASPKPTDREHKADRKSETREEDKATHEEPLPAKKTDKTKGTAAPPEPEE